MAFLDSMKVAAAVGLLMQQTTAFCCPNQMPADSGASGGRYVSILRNSTLQPEQKVSDAIQTIDGLRETLEKAYLMLSKAGYDHIHKVISELQPETVSLCELQLRGLEGLVKNVYREVSAEQREAMRPTLLTVAKARSAASNLNHLIHQMTKEPESYVSNISMDGLRQLADHGTSVMIH